jgi:hypothetical protein
MGRASDVAWHRFPNRNLLVAAHSRRELGLDLFHRLRRNLIADVRFYRYCSFGGVSAARNLGFTQEGSFKVCLYRITDRIGWPFHKMWRNICGVIVCTMG